ncbi:sialate O-acetylesterase [Pontibacter sp. BT731]|uniref:sialate O-acetylesterase n=1 Tax=Pontibacter coccineus TaxID=3063328 RepID=UPI0026E2D617|nr:sialate O-acetylesterase [Pontibacter sp. BT731]MDO6391144.1 sialate O-acetylesterase [Pontibacter sp. BT731]
MMPFHLLLAVILLLTSCSCGNDPNKSRTNSVKIFLVAGQSNAKGLGNQTESPDNTSLPTFEYFTEDNSIRPIKDPVGYAGCYFEAAESGSAWPAFSKRYYELSGDSIVIVQAAKGGSACHKLAETNNWGNWSKDGNLFNCSINKAQMASQYMKTSISGVIWSQGENDADAINSGIITKTEYKDALKDVIKRYRGLLGENVKFYIILTGYNTTTPTKHGSNAVRAAQDEIAQEDSSTFIVYRRTDKFPEFGWMHDAVHYNQQGLNDIGTVSADIIFKSNN